jgi:hypothetical protein
MTLDQHAFPRATEYLQALPQGIDSYPDCQVRSDAFEQLRIGYPDLAKAPGLPGVVAHFLSGGYSSDWLPEVAGNTLLLMLRDSQLQSDEQFRIWACDDSFKIFRRPLYKALMFILSPALVVMGAAKRWGAFHKGSELYAPPIRQADGVSTVIADLSYPSNLFYGLSIDRQGQAFVAALRAASAKDPVVQCERLSDTQSRFVSQWRSG